MSFAGRRRGNKVKKGVQFTVMVVGRCRLSVIAGSSMPALNFGAVGNLVTEHGSHLGASGTGRTTFVNTLCESEVLAHKVSDHPESAHLEEGIRIKPATVGKARHFHRFPSMNSRSFFLHVKQSSRRMVFESP